MHEPPLAAWLDAYRLDARSALQTAAAQGFRLVQANTVNTELAPAALSQSGRRHLRKILSDLGLRFDALAVEHAGGIDDPAQAQQRFDQLQQAVTLCRDLGVGSATFRLTGLGDERREALSRELLAAAADLADRSGVRLAIFPGSTDPAAAASAIRRLDCRLLAAGLDVAAQSDGGTALLAAAGPAVGAVSLRDVRRAGNAVEETEFGQGEVDFRRALAELDAAGYRHALLIRRDRPTADVDALRRARDHIASLLAAARR